MGPVGYIKTCGSNGTCVRVLCRVQGTVALSDCTGGCVGQVAHGLLTRCGRQVVMCGV